MPKLTQPDLIPLPRIRKKLSPGAAVNLYLPRDIKFKATRSAKEMHNRSLSWLVTRLLKRHLSLKKGLLS